MLGNHKLQVVPVSGLPAGPTEVVGGDGHVLHLTRRWWLLLWRRGLLLLLLALHLLLLLGWRLILLVRFGRCFCFERCGWCCLRCPCCCCCGAEGRVLQRHLGAHGKVAAGIAPGAAAADAASGGAGGGAAVLGVVLGLFVFRRFVVDVVVDGGSRGGGKSRRVARDDGDDCSRGPG